MNSIATTLADAPVSNPLSPSGTTQPPTQPDIVPLRSKVPAKALEPQAFPNSPKGQSNLLPCTIPNLAHLLKSYGIHPRYNIIKKKLEIRIPDSITTTDNADNVALTHIISLAALNGLPSGQIPAYVEVLGDDNAYNPVAEWINIKPWDGIDRLPEIYATLETQPDYPRVLKDRLIYRWLLSAVAAALKPRGFKARGVLTLQGAQGIGKTSWLKALVTDPVLRETVIKVDHHLDGNNKDSILSAIAHWLVEIGELDSSFRKDIARLKGFLTADQDKVRRPYARGDSEYARRTVFYATVNDANFLVDTTGNSRWWTIPVTRIDFQHGIDMQQLFAQLAADYNRGEQWWLTPEEDDLLESVNREHTAVNAIREQVLAVLDLDDKPHEPARRRSTTAVLQRAGIKQPSNSQCKDCAAVLREFLGEPKKVKGYMTWPVSFVDPFSAMNAELIEAVADDGEEDDIY